MSAQSSAEAAGSHDYDLKGLSRDRSMSDAEVAVLMTKLGDKKRPLDEGREIFLARQVLKELESSR